MMKSKGLRITVLFIVVAAIIVFMFFAENSLSLQRRAKTALEDSVNKGEELPVGEYVSCEARYVIGPFAEQVSTSFFNTIKLSSRETGYFYYLLLSDETVMVINTANEEEKAAFDRISEKLLDAQEYITEGESRRVNGRLRELNNEELKKIYQKDVEYTFGISPDDPSVRYLILDTTAGREWVFYIAFGAMIAVITGFIIAEQRKSKSRTVPME